MVTTNFLCVMVHVVIYLNHQNDPNQMKTRFYILLILLLSFSVANAQKDSTEVKAVSVNELNVNPVSKINFSISTELINVKELNTTNEVIARSSSDIRIYLNKERNVHNIKLLFPKIYKEKMA